MNNEKQDVKISKEELEMKILLYKLKETEYWHALNRYISMVTNLAKEYICTGDPLTNASGMLKNQGIKYGLDTFKSYIENMKDPEEVLEEDE